ncbi:hypothetical protein MNBD_GAMMA21-2166 [hydrothermal vent metagenome]|uniref:Uncharacterized protein n=1 Tax=hydrothermal vent metagenome TaxID=652676 RepID=A0A3B1ACM4_9ZZZZ
MSPGVPGIVAMASTMAHKFPKVFEFKMIKEGDKPISPDQTQNRMLSDELIEKIIQANAMAARIEPAGNPPSDGLSAVYWQAYSTVRDKI